jgi:hypothetical protein
MNIRSTVSRVTVGTQHLSAFFSVRLEILPQGSKSIMPEHGLLGVNTLQNCQHIKIHKETQMLKTKIKQVYFCI